MALILLRHTRPAGGDGRCYGQSDLAVGPGFAAEAAAIDAGLPPVAFVVTSPLRRARRLAEALAERRGLDPHEDPRLAELDFGSWENVAWDAVPRAELDAWAGDFLLARPGGGESVAMLAARVAEALADWGRRPGAGLLVTHAGVIRAARALAGEPNAWTSHIGFGRWTSLG
jgi:alpha-ribazole phosphatase